MRPPHVLIVGAGFGGLYAARALRRAPVRITVVDRRNHHLFQPLLYQVATAALSPAEIAAPVRNVLRRQRNTEVLMAEVTGVDPGTRQVRLADGRALSYDYLVLAPGVRHHYFGHPEWERHAPGLKTVEDALTIRRRFLLAFEAAEQEPDAERQRSLLTFVVVGGGPTGVEMAGAMSEIARHALTRDFRRIDPASARILLVEAGPRVLPAYPVELSENAEDALSRLGVEVRTDAAVTGVDAHSVVLGEERVFTHNVIWAAGVMASPLGAALGAPLDGAGRVRVRDDLAVPDHPEILVIGDLAAFIHPTTGHSLPGVAPVAMQQARHAARNILGDLRGEARRPFLYRDRGSMATIGRAAAVADFGRVRISGVMAWFSWLFIHIFFLIGFRNRILVLIQWAYSYLSFRRGARLITGEVGPTLAHPGRPLGEAPPAPRGKGERTGA